MEAGSQIQPGGFSTTILCIKCGSRVSEVYSPVLFAVNGENLSDKTVKK